ncbi:MAG TPA: ABC transporter permease [Stellaceae bacterium]|nr:ABC transporter permease [Stellaceae bacterium]
MGDFGNAVGLALAPMLRGDPDLYAIVRLSLWVSLSAVAIALLAGLPAGAALAVYRFPARRAVVILANSMLGLPPVVVGLAGYLLLSRSGPLGRFGLLYTPGAMVAVQTVLTLPIVVALVHRAAQEQWARHGDALQVAGATRLKILPHLLLIARRPVLTALLAALGRAISEVGTIIIVGGNIAGVTRTMTTTIVLETSKGNLPLAQALGFMLITLSVALSGVAFAIADRKDSRWLDFCSPS